MITVISMAITVTVMRNTTRMIIVIAISIRIITVLNRKP